MSSHSLSERSKRAMISSCQEVESHFATAVNPFYEYRT